MVKYPVSQPLLGNQELEAVNEVVSSGWISSLGSEILDFEREFAAFCGTSHALTVANGTVALHLVLHALGIKEGDEVIVPNLTFVATANAVRYCNATPVFVDVEPGKLTMDTSIVEKSITSRTKAIIPVHLFGQVCDMDKLLKICKVYNIDLVEDCAEAHGASWNGKKVGSFGIAGTFSFYANKIITTGEGGMIVTSHEGLKSRMSYLRDHAMKPDNRYWHTEMGFNYRLTNIQAAIGRQQLLKIDFFLQERDRIEKMYEKFLLGKGVSLFKKELNSKTVCWLFTVSIDNYESRIEIIELTKRLKAKGVDSRPMFYPMSHLPYFNQGESQNKYPNTEKMFNTCLSLPTYVGMSEEDVKEISLILLSAI